MKKILVPVDFNPLATAALRHAAALARREGAALIVMYADTFEPPAEFTAGQTAELAASIEDSRRKTAEELEAVRARARSGDSHHADRSS